MLGNAHVLVRLGEEHSRRPKEAKYIFATMM